MQECYSCNRSGSFFCFFPCTARLWNSLPAESFVLTYDLNDFKPRIYIHLSTQFILALFISGFFPIIFLISFLSFASFLVTPYHVLTVLTCVESLEKCGTGWKAFFKSEKKVYYWQSAATSSCFCTRETRDI